MNARGEAMAASRRLDSQLRRERVIAAVDARLAAGEELSIAAVARQAAVSRKFIYAHPDLRAQIAERARRHHRHRGAAAVADGQVTVASLRTELANARADNHRLRRQVEALEQRLSEALGHEVAEELEPGAERPEELRRRLELAEAEVFERGEALADAREELDAAREINRELLAARNRADA
ncbi:MAG: DUF6262 family protein [Solirubrobacterales bacterium]